MDITFIAFLNLTPEANILFVSDSITEILGYEPEEVVGRPSFEFFHPHEVPHARSIFERSVKDDRAALLYYMRLLSKDGRWITCECSYTTVHDVVVACASVYYHGEKSRRRAIEGAQVRRVFSIAPRDPRYHMLQHMSPKFYTPPNNNEPRAALILNRFSTSLSVMFATSAVTEILGSSPDEIRDRSFYRYMQQRCLAPALKCLESAKANDSIAYLRFWSRDPREDWNYDNDTDDGFRSDRLSVTSDSEGGGADLDYAMDVDDGGLVKSRQASNEVVAVRYPLSTHDSSDSLSDERHSADSMYGPIPPQTPATSTSSVTAKPIKGFDDTPRRRVRPKSPSIEVEAVISCASDGLVVVLRKARPAPKSPQPEGVLAQAREGLFAAPWGQQPMQPYITPQQSTGTLAHGQPAYTESETSGGPDLDLLMNSIRETAVFAWALCGINGELAKHSKGKPEGKSQPPALPIWDPKSDCADVEPPENQASVRYEREHRGQASALLPSPSPYPLPMWNAPA